MVLRDRLDHKRRQGTDEGEPTQLSTREAAHGSDALPVTPQDPPIQPIGSRAKLTRML
jgi:hypothetical protein